MTLQVSPQTKRVFHLSLPIFAELLLQLLVGNMDQFMISHFAPPPWPPSATAIR